jgi:hypothetical protein
MIDVVIDGSVTRPAATGGGAGLGGLGITALPTRLSELRQQLQDAVRDTLLFGAEREVPLDVSALLRIVLPAGTGFAGAAFAAVSAADRFSVSLSLPVDERQLDDGFTFLLSLRAVVPDGFSGAGGVAGQLTPADIPAGTPGATPGAQLVAVMQGRLRNLKVGVSTKGLERFSVTVAPPPGENGRGFRDIGNALVELLAENGAQLGVGVLRGDQNTRTANVFLAPGARAQDLWFRIRRSADVQVDEPSTAATLGRSVLTTPAIGFSERIAMMRIEETIGVGSLSAEIAETAAVTDTPFVYKDLDIDLTRDERLRVRCKVGLGFEWSGAIVMAQRLGEFEGQYVFGIEQDNRQPFDFDQLASVVTVTGVSSSFDWLPGTDLDDLNGQDYVEATVAAFISEQVVSRVRQRIGDRVVERAEEALEPIRERLADLAATAAEVEASVFVQLNSLEVTVDEIRLVARGGVWHRVLEVLGAEIECAVTQAAMMTRRRAVLPVARIVERRLAKKELRPWAEAYARHKADLARILKANPELATAVARAIVDGAPVAVGLAHVLSPDLRRRALQIARSIAGESKGELGAIAALGVRLIETHDTHTPLFRRAEELAAELPVGLKPL